MRYDRGIPLSYFAWAISFTPTIRSITLHFRDVFIFFSGLEHERRKRNDCFKCIRFNYIWLCYIFFCFQRFIIVHPFRKTSRRLNRCCIIRGLKFGDRLIGGPFGFPFSLQNTFFRILVPYLNAVSYLDILGLSLTLKSHYPLFVPLCIKSTVEPEWLGC